jgi:hypothetical protein
MSESQFAKAFAAAQAQLTNPKFDKVNTAFGKPSGYASLPSVLDAIRPVLNKHGIGVLQLVTNAADGKFSLTTRLTHVSGESVESTFSMPLPADPQKAVAMSTYLRRMSLSSMLGVCGDEDDDGNVASAPTIAQEAPKARKSPVAAPTRTEAAMAGTAAPAGVLRFEGVVERIYENEKSSKIVLESGEQLVAWNDLAGLETMQVGGRYWFSCKPSKNPKYPAPSITDFGEAGLQGGEEIPF